MATLALPAHTVVQCNSSTTRKCMKDHLDRVVWFVSMSMYSTQVMIRVNGAAVSARGANMVGLLTVTLLTVTLLTVTLLLNHLSRPHLFVALDARD